MHFEAELVRISPGPSQRPLRPCRSGLGVGKLLLKRRNGGAALRRNGPFAAASHLVETRSKQRCESGVKRSAVIRL